VADVLVGLLGCKDLLDNFEVRANLCVFGEDLLAVLFSDLGATLL
jgi:hypothetical protein